MSLKILLADDEAFIRQAYKDGMERAGLHVTVAQDGEEALALIKTDVPDIILLDLIMPKMNGFEVLKALKADPAYASIPVVILSNLSQSTDEAEVRQLGAVDFLIKSDYSLEQIIEKVSQVVGSSNANPA
jgi:CheY-like chemotaxis protein